MMLDIRNKADLLRLIDESIFESRELEYKGYYFERGKMEARQRDKLIKEISAFANTNGGTIIIGLHEDDNGIPSELSATGVNRENYDDWLLSLRQSIASKVRPHLHGIKTRLIKLADKEYAIVIHVPKSPSRPHSVWGSSKDVFYIRNANGIGYMDIEDLRSAFLRSEGLHGQVRQFHRERLSMILANECIGDLGSGAMMVFHILPEWSFDMTNRIDVRRFTGELSLRPFFESDHKAEFNADGFCVLDRDPRDNTVAGYAQVFHNGSIEAAEIRLVSKQKTGEMSDWNLLQTGFVKGIGAYAELLDEKLDVPKPWYIMGTILNGRGYVTTIDGQGSRALERDIIDSQIGVWSEDMEIREALTPVLDSLSNAFGYAGTSVFRL